MTTDRYVPERGDIVWANLDPRVGREQSGHRPALVVSKQEFSRRTGFVMICPITSKVKGLSFEIKIQSGEIDGAVLPMHLRSIDMNARKVSFMNRAPSDVTLTVLQILEDIMQ